jgi:hypothetical protein
MSMKNIGARGVAECAFEVLDSSGVGNVYAEQIYSSQKLHSRGVAWETTISRPRFGAAPIAKPDSI